MKRLGVMALAVMATCHGGEIVSFSGRAMGTSWTVKFVQPASPLARDEMERRVAQRLEALEQMFSNYRPDSDISRFNARANLDWQPVSPEIAHVAVESQAISKLTGGAFDPTVFPLVRLWGFASERRVGAALPTEEEIRTARETVDWRNLEARCDAPALRKRVPGVAVDFSSMAKGFASDEIARLLRESGAAHCFVQIAGDILCSGRAADGRPWRVGIEEPREDGRTLGGVVELSDRAVSTSGNYRNFFRVGIRRYGHIIDPRIGVPVTAGVAAVSVVERSCARSSALATGLFVLGPEEGWKLAVRERVACMFFVERADGTFVRHITPEFERLLVQTQLSSAERP